jgi:two-component system response regulator RegX3
MAMNAARILVVEDEAPIREGLCDALRFAGHEPHQARDGREGLEQALAGGFDLVLLDVMMPELDGFAVCEQLRKAIPGQAICLLTAKGREEDVLNGFECGADDYVAKPFSVRQLLARVAALLRRTGAQSGGTFAIGDLTIDPARLRATRGDREVDLNRRDIEILACLDRAGGRILSRQQLLQEVWGYGRIDGVETRCVDMHIVKLRRKLGEGLGVTADRLIETVRGEGYRLVVGAA